MRIARTKNVFGHLSTACIVIGFSLLVACSNTSEPNEYVTYLDRFFTFEKKGVMLANKRSQSAHVRGFADFTGDGLTDMYEIRDEEFSETDFEIFLFVGSIDEETHLLVFSDPYKIKINAEKERNWSKYLTFEPADVNGDGFSDLILSEFIEDGTKDKYNIVVLFNKGFYNQAKKISFKWINEIIDKRKATTLTKSFLKNLSEREAAKKKYCLGSDCTTRDYHTVKWADMDGNGTDDFVLLWRESRESLYVEVFYSNAPASRDDFDRLSFSFHANYQLPNIFNNDYRTYFSLASILAKDVNGDGLSDFILVREKSHERVFLKFALNTTSFRRSRGLSFMTDATTAYPEVDWDLVSEVSDKVVTFDLNADGCADYAHIGESSYFPFGPKGKEIEDVKIIYYMLTDCKKAKLLRKKLSFAKKQIAVQWPLDRVPNERENVVELIMPAQK